MYIQTERERETERNRCARRGISSEGNLFFIHLRIFLLRDISSQGNLSAKGHSQGYLFCARVARGLRAQRITGQGFYTSMYIYIYIYIYTICMCIYIYIYILFP